MNNKIDLHIHSTASDGADPIPQLLEKILKAELHTFAITDHDTITGSQLMETLVPKNLNFIRGIEFSCTTSYRKCHILGYNFDPAHASFQNALNLVKKLRREKVDLRIAFLENEFGIVLTENELASLNGEASPGKPNFGKIIVERGLAPDIRTAISKYVNPCKTPRSGIDSDIAVKAILNAGGIPVWAHPLGGEGERRLTKEEFETQLTELISNGIKGLECFYSRYTQDEIDFLIEQANIHNLFISGGSDYHGSNKTNINLGKLNTENLPINTEYLTLFHALESMFK